MTEQAIEELIRKYATGAASEEEERTLMEWYRANPAHDVYWTTSNPHEKEELYGRMLARLHQDIFPGRARVIRLRWMSAAAVVLIAGLATVLYWSKPFSSSTVTITNASGKIQELSLPDHSKIWLNASSSISYPRAFKNDRRITLKGEAFFEVAHDAQHPFVVHAGGIETTVLGTSFDVKAYESDRETIVSLIHGKVKLVDASKTLGVLTNAQEIKFDRQRKTAEVFKIDTAAVAAWRRGRLQFQGETLADIAKALERWYGVKIVFKQPGTGSCRYYMSFDSQMPIQKLFSSLSEITETEYVFDGQTISISGKACK